MEVRAAVEAYFEATDGSAHHDDLVADLRGRGIDAVTAACLVAFVPIACARLVLEPLGVPFLETYLLIRDFPIHRRARGRFADEPIYQAAFELARERRAAGGEPWQRVHRLAETTAEFIYFKKNGVPEKAIERIFGTIPIDHLVREA